MTHEPRLLLALRTLLHQQRVAALATVDEDGAPQVSMVPFSLCADDACLVIHVSALAAHTGHLQRHPAVSLLVMQAEVAGEPVHALPRTSITGQAQTPAADSPLWQACRTSYLQRFPEAEPMTELGDFRFVAIHVHGARQIAGFGAARTVELPELVAAMHA